MTRPATEARHPASDGLHLRTPAEALAALLSAQVSAVSALHRNIEPLAAVADAAAEAVSRGGRLG